MTVLATLALIACALLAAGHLLLMTMCLIEDWAASVISLWLFRLGMTTEFLAWFTAMAAVFFWLLP